MRRLVAARSTRLPLGAGHSRRRQVRRCAPVTFSLKRISFLLTPYFLAASASVSRLRATQSAAGSDTSRAGPSQLASSSMVASQSRQPAPSRAGAGGCWRRPWASSCATSAACRVKAWASLFTMRRCGPRKMVAAENADGSTTVSCLSTSGAERASSVRETTGMARCSASFHGSRGSRGANPISRRTPSEISLASVLNPQRSTAHSAFRRRWYAILIISSRAVALSGESWGSLRRYVEIMASVSPRSGAAASVRT